MKQFTQRYVDELVKQVQLVHKDDYDEKELRKFVAKLCNEKFTNKKVSIENDTYKKELSLLQLIKYFETEKPIITGFGTLFVQHKVNMSPEFDMIEDFQVLRDKNKDKKFEHLNDEDATLMLMFDSFQLTYKLLMNSDYGAAIEENSFFYHPELGPSITLTGQTIIMTSIVIFESFLADNFYFHTLTDVTNYVSNIIQEDYDSSELKSGTTISVKKLFGRLYSKLQCQNDFTKEKVMTICTNLTEEERIKVYFKNNFYEAIQYANKKVINNLKSMLGNETFLDPNDPPEGYAEKLVSVWKFLEKYVYYNHLDFYRDSRCRYHTRRAVLGCDTDSNFIYCYPFFHFCKEYFEIEDTETIRMTTTNIYMYFVTAVVTNIYSTLTKQFGIEGEKYRKYIKMKNEFYFSRMMLTSGKKNYATLPILQEGRIIKNPKVDIKGLAIKKISTNKRIRKHFTDIVEQKILMAKKINVAEIYKESMLIENEIRDSLSKGESEFSIPVKINELESYNDKTVFQEQQVRGYIAWNALFPENTINPPDKINKFVLKSLPYEDLCSYIYDCSSLTEEEQENIIQALTENIYKHSRLSKYGFSVLCAPKSCKKLPEWIIGLIDIDKLVEVNLKPGYTILKHLGLKMLSYQVGDSKGDVLSNIITL
jgi:hypothetical protein